MVGPLQVVRLAAGQEEVDRLPSASTKAWILVLSPRASADRLVLTDFFRAPALCWWARTTVLSIIAYSLSASAATVGTSAPRHRFRQRLNRVGSSSPHRTAPQIAPWHPGTITVQHRLDEHRLSTAVTPTEPSRPGNRFLIRSHWSSRSPNRRISQPPNKLTAYELKKPPRRNSSRITRCRLTAKCGNRDSPA